MTMTNAKQPLHNEAFIDGQNLHLGTTHSDPSWKVDVVKFREYLRKKFSVERAYYFLGCFDDDLETMYTSLQEADYILVFRNHSESSLSHKKGNVDTDLVFQIMYKLHRQEKIDQIFLISGDGDYYKLVKFLRDEGKLGKIIFPAKSNASSLYRRIAQRYKMFLDDPDVKKKIAYTRKKR